MTEIHAFDPDGTPSPGATAGVGTLVAGAVSTDSAVRDALMTTLTTTGTRPVGKGEIVLNARDAGAAGDGVADDTAALQAAIDSAGGRDVFVPRGRYRLTATINLPGGATLRGESGTVLVNDGAMSEIIRVAGFTGTPRKIATAVGSGDRVIATAVAHGFVEGDIVRFVSQRVSTSADAGEWRLGYPTGSSGPRFGEHATVKSVESATSFTLDGGLVFPSYRPDKTQETDPAAGDYATVERVSGARNVVISTLELEGPSSNAIRLSNAVGCLVDNIRYEKPDKGRFIQFDHSYRCEARNSWVSNQVPSTENPTLAEINSYHIVGSQSCGFNNCTVIAGTQAFDITYSSTSVMPSLFCYVKNSSSYGSLSNPITTHPGTFASVIQNNALLENQGSGIGIRSNRSIVSGNQISGSGTGTGIYVYEGAGTDSIVTGNHVSNFDVAMSIHDGADKWYPGWIGVVVAGNYFTEFSRGYRRITQLSRPLPTGPQGISLQGNSFVSSRAAAIGVETSESGRPIWGLAVQGNSFRLTGGGDTVAVSVTNNSRAVSVTGNTFWQAGKMLDRVTTGGALQWPEPCVTTFTGNDYHSVGTRALPAPSSVWKLRSYDPEPHLISTHSLDQFTETCTIYPSANSLAIPANGYPSLTGSTATITKITKRTEGSTVQEVSNGDGKWYRRSSGGAWPAWTRQY